MTIANRMIAKISISALLISQAVAWFPSVRMALAAPPTCNGQTATIYVEGGLIVSTIAADNGDPYTGTLNGGNGTADVIVGTSGDDTINGNGQNDTICGGGGNDTINGGNGSDWIDGEGGNDSIDGGNGTDTLFGGDGDDTLLGDNGGDTMTGGNGNDFCDQGTGPGQDCEAGSNEGILTIVKDASPDNAQDFTFSGTAPIGNFSLDDDGDGTLPNSQSFTLSGAIAPVGTNYSVTETSIPAGWDLTAIVCDDTGDASTTTNLGTATATVNLDEGDIVTCTFTNTQQPASSASSSVASSSETSSSVASSAVSSSVASSEISSSVASSVASSEVSSSVASSVASSIASSVSSAPACVSDEADLSAYWKLDEGSGSSAADSTAFNNAGVLQNGAAWAVGGAPVSFANPASLVLDGTDDFVLVSDTTGLPTAGGARTVALWMKQDAITGQATLVSLGNVSDANQKFIVQMGTAGLDTYLFTDSINGTNNIQVTGAEIPTTGVWHHLAFTLDGSNNWKYYLDGSLTKSGTFPVAINTVTNDVEIGSRHDVTAGFFDGTLDDVRLYNRALSHAEIADLSAGKCEGEVAVCGNGEVEPPEQCDDGNTTPGDGCSAICQTTVQCSDGVDNADSEDALVDAGDPGCHTDGNVANILSYDPNDNDESHTFACQNGVTEGAEQCDDGNTANGDGCSNSCTIEVASSSSSSVVSSSVASSVASSAISSSVASSAVSSSAASSVSSSSAPTCNGLTATIYVKNGLIVSTVPADNGDPYTGELEGTFGNDVIVGTNGDDEIDASGGNDTICALGGNDDVQGGFGVDWIDGGTGDDEIDAGSDADKVFGFDGNDRIEGGAGNDVLCGEASNDTITGGTGNDIIDGAAGTDPLSGGANADTCYNGEPENCESTPAGNAPQCAR